ncbi:MAG: DNA mismatch repair endonuclease MutL [Desulfovibrio sp.]|uniref:DNA mismatch repair endonuclease MutL n=1 Tax=Desulfovibrio sp. 7SRBS1 TaxID=3378064 RepID=UPI003B421EC2
MAQQRAIRPLPPELANQIAAGEVVERPASVIKEMAENSLDAGADSIAVNIEHGGQSLIRMVDNGYGIVPDQLELAVTRHATSKIASLPDLSRIQSLGFRGEALASVCSVSRFRIASRPHDAEEGAELSVEFGSLSPVRPTAMRPGTIVEVHDLFANVPARLKFLKTEPTEAKRCHDALFRLALGAPHAGFSFTSNGRQLFDFPPGQSLIDRLSLAWPPALCEELTPFDLTREDMRAHGLAGSPMKAQGRADRMLFFVNNRPVADKILLQAARDAYKGRLLAREYPQIVLFLELSPTDVDVNVHPAKMEVRFRYEREVFGLIRAAVLSALERSEGMGREMEYEGLPSTALHSGIQPDQRATEHPASESLPLSPKFPTYKEFKEPGRLPLTPSPSTSPFPGLSGRSSTSREATRGLSSGVAEETTDFLASNDAPNIQQNIPRTPDFQDTAPSRPAQIFGEHRERVVNGMAYLGQIAGTYLILRLPDGSLGLLDQHAAHERVLYEAMRQRGEHGNSHPLAIPMDMPLHPSERSRLEEIWGRLKSVGFTFGETTEKSLQVTGVPPSLEPGKALEYLRSVLSEQATDIRDIWIMLSCKAAIKAGDELALDEALALLETWSTTQDKEYCPHGRPALVRFGEKELERLFKRK